MIKKIENSTSLNKEFYKSFISYLQSNFKDFVSIFTENTMYKSRTLVKVKDLSPKIIDDIFEKYNKSVSVFTGNTDFLLNKIDNQISILKENDLKKDKEDSEFLEFLESISGDVDKIINAYNNKYQYNNSEITKFFSFNIKKNSIKGIPFLFFDLDFKDNISVIRKYLPDIESTSSMTVEEKYFFVSKFLEDSKFIEETHPNAVIFSGNGLHIVYSVGTNDFNDRLGALILSKMNDYFEDIFSDIYGVGSVFFDNVSRTLTKPFRLPGGVNRKNGNSIDVELVCFNDFNKISPLVKEAITLAQNEYSTYQEEKSKFNKNFTNPSTIFAKIMNPNSPSIFNTPYHKVIPVNVFKFIQNNISVIDILSIFGYELPDVGAIEINEDGWSSVIRAPYRNDNNPSFQFNDKKFIVTDWGTSGWSTINIYNINLYASNRDDVADSDGKTISVFTFTRLLLNKFLHEHGYYYPATIYQTIYFLLFFAAFKHSEFEADLFTSIFGELDKKDRVIFRPIVNYFEVLNTEFKSLYDEHFRKFREETMDIDSYYEEYPEELKSFIVRIPPIWVTFPVKTLSEMKELLNPATNLDYFSNIAISYIFYYYKFTILTSIKKIDDKITITSDPGLESVYVSSYRDGIIQHNSMAKEFFYFKDDDQIKGFLTNIFTRTKIGAFLKGNTNIKGEIEKLLVSFTTFVDDIVEAIDNLKNELLKFGITEELESVSGLLPDFIYKKFIRHFKNLIMDTDKFISIDKYIFEDPANCFFKVLINADKYIAFTNGVVLYNPYEGKDKISEEKYERIGKLISYEDEYKIINIYRNAIVDIKINEIYKDEELTVEKMPRFMRVLYQLSDIKYILDEHKVPRIVDKSNYNLADKCINYFLGSSLYPPHGNSKAVFLRGKGKNGKSTLTKVLNALYGERYTDSTSIDYLLNRNTDKAMQARVKLVGKLISLTEESNLQEITNDFKKLVTYDKVDVRELYAKSFSVRLRAHFLINLNNFPKFDADSTMDAFLRRILFVVISGNLPNEYKEDNIEEKIIAFEAPYIWKYILEQAKLYYKYDINAFLNEKEISKLSRNIIADSPYQDFAFYNTILIHPKYWNDPELKDKIKEIGISKKSIKDFINKYFLKYGLKADMSSVVNILEALHTKLELIMKKAGIEFPDELKDVVRKLDRSGVDLNINSKMPYMFLYYTDDVRAIGGATSPTQDAMARKIGGNMHEIITESVSFNEEVIGRIFKE